VGTQPLIQRPTVTPEEEPIGIFVQYDTLMVADLTDILSHLVRAYNVSGRELLDASITRLGRSASPLHDIVLVNEAPPLRLDQATTGKSITLLLIGAGTAVLNLALAAKKLFDTRQAYWQSKKTKWEAKEAEHNFRDRLNEPHFPPQKAITQVSQLVDTVNDSPRISAFRLKIGNYLTIEHVKVTPDERSA
jgi:hypothetical protein